MSQLAHTGRHDQHNRQDRNGKRTKRDRVRLIQPTQPVHHSPRSSYSGTISAPRRSGPAPLRTTGGEPALTHTSHTETLGALALLEVDQVVMVDQLDTQPLPALHPVVARRHILIVEDDAQVTGVIRAALELEGERDWAVQAAREGSRALELATTTPPDLVLLDVRLPGMDGAEVYHRLRANAETNGARILFLSAGTSFDLAQRGIEDGVLLRKPFDMPLLVSLVRALLRS